MRIPFMPSRFQIVLQLLLATVLWCAAWSASAQAGGSAVFVTGDVRLARGGTTVALARGSEIRAGDTIITGADGQAQLRMSDNSFIAVRSGTRMTVEQYAYGGANDGAVYALASGVMRMFTGLIAQKDRSKVRMRTPISTVGVRGSGNILAHSDDLGTINHTLTGIHAVSVRDAAGGERTLLSRPGQTIQVLPGALPKFIPAPPFLFSAASGPLSASSELGSLDQLLSLADDLEGGEELTEEEEELLLALILLLIDDLLENQLPPDRPATGSARFSFANPGAGGGRIGVLLQPSTTFGEDFLFGFDNELLAMDRVSYGTFISGSGALPAGFTPVTIPNAFIEFDGGEAHDLFRNDESSIIQGRWQGGQVIVTDNDNPNAAPIVHELGNTSVAWQVYQVTHPGVIGSFTGTTNYQLVSATAPTDAFGNIGTVNQLALSLNFSNRTASGNLSLSINNQTLGATLSNLAIQPSGQISISLVPTMISCVGGGCNSTGYAGAFNASLSGPTGSWIAANYRFSPTRPSGSGLTDHIAGYAALQAVTRPTAGIVLPVTGTASLALSSFNPFNSAGANPVSVTQSSGSINANFTNRTVDVSLNLATLQGGAAGSLALSASAVPLIGAGFVAGTTPDPRLSPSVGTLNVTCGGAACAAGTLQGRFDGLFNNNQGTGATAQVAVAGTSSTNPFSLVGQAIFGMAAPPMSPGARAASFAPAVQAAVTLQRDTVRNLRGAGVSLP